MIDTRSLVDRVYDYLLTQIVDAEIKYGDVINIKRVADALKISTMPVREALKRLEFERIVEIKPRSSCRLLKPSRKLIREVYELREAIELYAAQRATRPAGGSENADFRRLDAIVDEMRRLDEEGDVAAKEKAAIALDRSFHSELCALAGNDYMNDLHRQLDVHVNMTLIHERTYHKLERRWAESHAEIVRALETEPARVAEVLRRHFDNVLELLPAGDDPA
jgi:DNA-binding GntR family transcriptional regulator